MVDILTTGKGSTDHLNDDGDDDDDGGMTMGWGKGRSTSGTLGLKVQNDFLENLCLASSGLTLIEVEDISVLWDQCTSWYFPALTNDTRPLTVDRTNMKQERGGG